MRRLIGSVILQLVLLLPLGRKRRSGGKPFFRDQPWTGTTVVGLILLLNAFQLGAYAIGIAYPGVWPRGPSYLLHAYLALLVVGCVVWKKGALRHVGVRRAGAGRAVLLGPGVGLISYGVYHVLAVALQGGLDPSVLHGGAPGRPFLYVLYVFRAVIAGPIIEEALYRGILYPPYRARYGPITAVALGAVLFSLGHFEVTLDSIFVGLCWGALYERTETLVAPIAAHSTYNLLWVLSELR